MPDLARAVESARTLQRDREIVWLAVSEGINLRDEGIGTNDPHSWRTKCLAWQMSTIDCVAKIAPNLASALDPLGFLDKGDNAVNAGGIAHQKDVDAMSTIIRMVREHLMKTP